jgi:molybdopterin-binding protein
MKVSDRNVLPATVRKIEMGAVNAEVTLEVAPGVTLVSIITAESVKNLKLVQGGNA